MVGRGSRKRRRRGAHSFSSSLLRSNARDVGLESAPHDYHRNSERNHGETPINASVPQHVSVLIEHDECSGDIDNEEPHVVVPGNVSKPAQTGAVRSAQNPLQDLFDDSEDDMDWMDAIEIVADAHEQENNDMTQGTDSATSTSTPLEVQHEKRLEIGDLRKLLRGKSIEALSFVAGSRGMTANVYGWVSEVFNDYARQLRSPKYPCYATLINTTLNIQQSNVFVRQSTIDIPVNISRAGIQERYVNEHRRGFTPTVSITVVAPSQWGKKDLRL